MAYANLVDYSFNKTVAQKYGVNGAMILNRIVWSLNTHVEKDDRFFIDGTWWMYDTYDSIAAHFDGFISKSSVKEKIRKFEADGLLISKRMNSQEWKQTKWYSLCEEKWLELNSPKRHINKPELINTSNSIDRNLTPALDNRCPIDGVPPCPIDGTSHTPIEGTSNVPSLLNNHSINHTQYSTKESVITPSASATGARVKKVQVIKSKYEPEDLKLAASWLEYALETMVWKKASASWTPEKWAADLAKVRRITDLNHCGLEDLFKFVKNDDFWHDKALSPAALLKKGSNDNRKIDNVLLQMRGNGHIERRKNKEALDNFINSDGELDLAAIGAKALKEMGC